MILTETVNIKRDPRYKHLIGKYELVNGYYINVKIEDLLPKSDKKILVKCDYCGEETYLNYSMYMKNTKNHTIEYSCKLCRGKKISRVKFNRTEEEKNKTKTKIKETWRNKPIEEVQDMVKKMKKTKKIKYNDENYQNKNREPHKESTKLKIKNAHLNQSKERKNEIKEKTKKTINKKYHSNTYSNSDKHFINDTLIGKQKNWIKYLGNRKHLLYCEKCKNNFETSSKLFYGRTKQNNITCTICNPIKIRKTNKYLSEYKLYQKIVMKISRSLKKQLIKNWDGYDYYDNEYIKDFFKFEHHHQKYPSVDHKISICFGFINNIDPYIIGGLDNLCITKRTLNNKKSKKNEKEFKKILNKIKNFE